MPDTTVPPLPPGKETSEFSLAKLFAIIGGVVSLALPILAGLSSTIDGLGAAFPGAKWVAVAGAVVGTMASVAVTVSKYVGGRADIKVAHLEASARAGAQAAEAVKTDTDAAGVLLK